MKNKLLQFLLPLFICLFFHLFIGTDLMPEIPDTLQVRPEKATINDRLTNMWILFVEFSGL